MEESSCLFYLSSRNGGIGEDQKKRKNLNNSDKLTWDDWRKRETGMTQLTNDYNRILKNIWSRAPAGIHNVWPEDAVKAVKALFKREFPQRKWPYEIKFTSGNRYTWVRRSLGKDGRFSGGRTVFINCEKGWEHLVHDWSHWLNFVHGDGRKAHCEEHLMLERDCAEYVISRGWVKSELVPVESTQANVVAKNFNKLQARKVNLLKKQAQYVSSLKRVENGLKKVERSIQQYENKYDNERLTALRIPRVNRKKAVRVHPRDKIVELQKQYPWLRLEVDTWYRDEFNDPVRFFVYHVDEEVEYEGNITNREEDYEETWTAAHREALRLIEKTESQQEG